jgi:hypothetical protein
VDRKQHKYAPLIRELEGESWNVRPTVHVITVGVRATEPLRNNEILKSLGIKEKPAQQKVQASMTHVAAAHLNIGLYPNIGDYARDRNNVLM